MRPLRTQDPEELGGHRLLARLGAGGMGVVYLARTPAGSLAALKIVHPEHAADPAFRERFRREARLAGGLSGRWVVRVTAADPDAREPWLATAYVPGPSLAEAVDACGPLPPDSVAALGAMLAEALAELHGAGLLHRDVKPGNVLLALDGPRLIDFGIARAAGATALTEPGAIVGTPGYLAPEQISTDGSAAGPAADVFALGCLLAYAATGRRPFGSGNPEAVLYRTLHEPPDLDGLHQQPPPLRAAIAQCLAKAPESRPTAADLTGLLSAQPATATGEEAQHDWLPPVVLRLVAERSARALDPPPREAAPEHPQPAPALDARTHTRRRVLAIAGSTTVVLAASAAALLAARDGRTGAGGTRRNLPTHTIGLHATLTGGDGAIGRAHERGARLAVSHHNSRDDARFWLRLLPYDDRGRPARTKETARRLLADRSLTAVIGPTTVAAARTAVPQYASASMPVLLVSIDDDTTGLAPHSLRTLCVTRASETNRTLPVIDYLTRVRRVERTAVVEDEAAGDAARRIVSSLREAPPGNGTVTVHAVAAADGFTATVTDALALHPDAVVYAGTSPDRAAACARALAQAGFDGPRATFEPVLRPAFAAAAGPAAEGWVLEAPYTEPQSAPGKAARSFTTAYRDRYGELPARWAAEAYDAVGLIAATLDDLGGGTDMEPGQVAERLFHISHIGIAKPLRFRQDLTHALLPEKTSFLYQVHDGRYRFLGRYDQVQAP
ncbi:bifunctional serine/threonine-protein kinase/ABC transporter substrate-binding protein [Streptomyces sp. NPDC004752]